MDTFIHQLIKNIFSLFITTSLTSYFVLLLVAFLSSYALTRLTIRICVHYKLLAYPSQSRWHRKPTALYGGIAFVFVTLIFSSMCLYFQWREILKLSFLKTFPIFSTSPPFSLPAANSPYLGLLFGSFTIFVFGLIDDITKLKPHYKLLGQLFAIAIATYFGLTMTFFESPILALFLTIFWFLGISNAFNLLDNMDGLAAGMAIAAAITVATHSWMQKNITVTILALILTSALLGFWIHNKNPAKIFMGDCGSQFLGFFLAGLSILGTWRDASNLLITLLLPVLFLAIPIFDTTYVSIMRKFHGRKISEGGKDHLSHRLVALGLSEHRAVNILILIGLVIGISTVFVLHNYNILLVWALVPLVIITFIVLGLYLSQINIYNSPAKLPIPIPTLIRSYVDLFKYQIRRWNPTDREGLLRFDFYVAYKRRFLEVISDITLLFLALLFAYNLRFEKSFSGDYSKQFTNTVVFFVSIKMAVFFWNGNYRGEWKYMGVADLLSLIKSSILSFFFIVTFVALVYHFDNFSRSVLILDFLLTIMFLGGVRLAIRAFTEYLFNHRKDYIPVILYGNDKDELYLTLKKLKLKMDPSQKSRLYKPMAIYYESGVPSMSGAIEAFSLQGVEVVNDKKRLYSILEQKGIKNILSLEPVNKSILLQELYSKGLDIKESHIVV
ncbi:MAG: hypothetical protein HQK53_15100 [Oligoflexia bacterium]|nr:hypothetical protein [Oligoflexia bacterium]